MGRGSRSRCSIGGRGSVWGPRGGAQSRGAGGAGGCRALRAAALAAGSQPWPRRLLRGSDDCAVPRATKFESAGRARLRPAPPRSCLGIQRAGESREPGALPAAGAPTRSSGPEGVIRNSLGLGGAGRALGRWEWGAGEGQGGGDLGDPEVVVLPRDLDRPGCSLALSGSDP